MKDVNKFVREIYSQKKVELTIYNLKAESDEDLVLVGWSDVALANRVDLLSIEGFVIGFVHKRMADQGEQGYVSVIT